MKRILAIILAIGTLCVPCFATEQKVEYSTITGIGRLVHTIQKNTPTEILITNVEQVPGTIDKWYVTLDSGSSWPNGVWLVELTYKPEAPSKGYWYYWYDDKFNKIAICKATKVRK